MQENKLSLKDLFKSILGSFCLEVHDFLSACSSMSDEEKKGLEKLLDKILDEHQRKIDVLMEGFILELEERFKGNKNKPMFKR